MIKKFTLSALLILCVTMLFGQRRLDIYKTFGGITFEYDSTGVSPRQVLNIMYMNSEAFREFKIARRYYTASGVCGFLGGAMVSVPLITAVLGGEPNWILGASGAVTLLATIPLSISYRNRALDAVEIYNEKKTSRIQPYYYFKTTGVGVGIRF